MRRYAILVALLLVLAPRAAVAQARADQFVIQLAAEPGSLPAVVCLAAPTASIRKGDEKLWTKYDDLVPPAANETDPANQDQKKPNEQTASAAKPEQSERPNVRAQHLLSTNASESVVFGKTPECRPATPKMPTGTQVLCRENPLAGQGATGVAIFELQFPGRNPRTVLQLTASGDLLTVTMRRPKKAEAGTIGVHVLGGHYRSSVRPFVGNQVQLLLEPRCYVRQIRLPDVEGASSSKLAPHLDYQEGQSSASADAPVGNALLSLRLPPGREGAQSTVTLSFPRPGAKEALAKYEVRWSTKVPPTDLELRPVQLSFNWVVPCEYPFRNECPHAWLGGEGSDLAGTWYFAQDGSPYCQYAVTTRSTTFQLPAEVTFKKKELPQWQSRLSRANQTLYDYLPPASRTFRVRMPWASKQEIADAINFVELLGPTGTRTKMTPAVKTLVPLPFAQCKSRVGYHLIGERDFHWGTTTIKDGEIVIKSPDPTAETVTLGVSLGGGVFVPFTRDDQDRPSGEVTFTARTKPGHWGARSFLQRINGEASLSYIVSTQPYAPLRTPDNRQDTSLGSEPYNRFTGELYAMSELTDKISIGPGAGCGLGIPVLAKDEPRVGGVNFFGLLGLRARYRVTRRLDFFAAGRVVFRDSFYRYYSADFRGSPQISKTNRVRMLFGAGVTGWL